MYYVVVVGDPDLESSAADTHGLLPQASMLGCAQPPSSPSRSHEIVTYLTYLHLTTHTPV